MRAAGDKRVLFRIIESYRERRPQAPVHPTRYEEGALPITKVIRPGPWRRQATHKGLGK